MEYRFPFLVSLACIAASVMLPSASADNTLPTAVTEPVIQEQNLRPLDECYKDGGDSASVLDIRKCLIDKAQDEELRLKNFFKREEQELQGIDSSGVPAALASLKESQKAFEAFRQAECKRINDATLGGTGAEDFQRDCEIRLTRWRIEQLQNN
ncbi:lysozyme inhibitor LprI family protein [Aeromonas jandaei]|uniref:lysozyme inhibitor LprI family protein n=1 Tax=Aeromonas sp. MdU4 TaxID=3342819 RepID=UPI0035B97A6A